MLTLAGANGAAVLTISAGSFSIADSNAVIESPYIKTTSPNGVRVKFGLIGTAKIGSAAAGPLYPNFNEKDTFYFEYTTDGENYTIAARWVKDDMPQISSAKTSLTMPLPLATSAFKFRMRWTNKIDNSGGATTRSLTFSDFLIEDIPDCDPIKSGDITVATDGTDALVKWRSQDITAATVFDVRYKVADDNSLWTTRQAAGDSILLRELPQAKLMNLEISAVCGVGKVSEWVAIRDFYFYTGYNTLPFYDDFNTSFTDWANAVTANGRKVSPAYWDEYRFSTEVPFDVFNGENTSGKIVRFPLNNLATLNYASLTTSWPFEWKGNYVSDVSLFNAGPNQAMTFGDISNTNGYPKQDWLLTKEIQNLQPNNKISFDIAMLRAASTGLPLNNPSPGAKFYVALIPSSGTDTLTVTKSNLLLELDSVEIRRLFIDSVSPFDSALGLVHYELDLSSVITAPCQSVTGRIGFNFVTNTTTVRNILYLDNVAIESPCVPIVASLNGDASVDSIKVDWSAANNVTEYLVKVNGVIKEAVTGGSYKYIPSEQGQYELMVGYPCDCDTVWSNVISVTVTYSCDVPANVRTTGTTITSATVAWAGPALVVGYNVQIRVLDSATAVPSAWTTYFTTDTVYTIQALEQGKIYEYRVQSKCGSAAGDTSDWSAIEQVTAVAITCFAPDNISVTPSYYSAVVSWSNNGAGNYEYAVRPSTVGDWGATVSVQDTTAVVGNLQAEKIHQVRVRSLCGGEISAWSDPVQFLTTSVPDCPLVTGLVATEVTATTATLSWAAPTDYAEFVVTYRDVNVGAWETAGDTSAELSRVLTDLTPNTAYTWRVRNLCDNDRSSGWANADNFNTDKGVAVEDLRSASTLEVYVSGKQINVLNPKNEYIESIALTSTNGAVLQKYTVRSRDNILVTATLRNQVVVVSIYGKNGAVVRNEKVLIK
jgi:hypothetical protein